MKNLNSQINTYFSEQVSMSKETRDNLHAKRDLNVERISEGQKRLENNGIVYPKKIDEVRQGGMAMGTANSSRNNESYDIDHAIIFKESDIGNMSAKDCRKMIEEMLNSCNIEFNEPPSARNNAVTVWYDGENPYHIDFAIYKCNNSGEYFHAGGENWNKRNPRQLTEWFCLTLKDSLGEEQHEQLKKVIRLLKYWSKSNSNWKMPGGLFLTVLAVNNYVYQKDRDDLSFIKTLEKIFNLLQADPRPNLINPTTGTSLYQSEHDYTKMKNLLKRKTLFDNFVSSLNTNFTSELKSLEAWGIFFFDPWFCPESKSISKRVNSIQTNSVFDKYITYRITHKKPGSSNYRQYSSFLNPIKIGHSIKFELITDLVGIKTSWEIVNSGDDAENAISERPLNIKVENEDSMLICKVDAVYTGIHKMVCKIEYKGQVDTKEFSIYIK